MVGAGTLPDGLAAPGAEPVFPPRLRGERADSQSPIDLACQRAAIGIDPGLITWRISAERIEAAIVLAPEQPLAAAMGVVLTIGNAFADALGALSPPEVAVQYDWPGGLRINGGRAGEITARAATTDPAAEPDWLVVGIAVNILPPAAPTGDIETDTTGLMAEGCGEVGPVALIESWSRHSLVWLNRFEEEGLAPIHRDWTGKAWRLGEAVPKTSPWAPGLFVGLDELGGMLVRQDGATRLIPLTAMLETS
ncbi:MAG: DUF4444 domain-containing protein [Pseudomonadota bacterium]